MFTAFLRRRVGEDPVDNLLAMPEPVVCKEAAEVLERLLEAPEEDEDEEEEENDSDAAVSPECNFAETFYAKHTILRHGYMLRRSDDAFVEAPFGADSYCEFLARNVRLAVDTDFDEMQKEFPNVEENTIRVLKAFSEDVFPIPILMHLRALKLNPVRFVFSNWQEAKETLDAFLRINSTLFFHRDDLIKACSCLFLAKDIDDMVISDSFLALLVIIQVPKEQNPNGYIGSGFYVRYNTAFNLFMEKKIMVNSSSILCMDMFGLRKPVHFIMNARQCGNCKKMTVKQDILLYDVESEFFKETMRKTFGSISNAFCKCNTFN